VLRELVAAGHRGAMIGTQPHGSSGNLDDSVLDPFWGTGTTTLAAMVAGLVLFAEWPGLPTLLGALVIVISALAVTRGEARPPGSV